MAQDRERSRSVFDFIYVDQSRIELYLAQFSEFGHLTGLVRSVAHSSGNALEGDIHILKGGSKSEQRSEIEKHYDPRWIGPLTFLEEASDRAMLKSHVEGARIGDIVILKGTLILVDARSLEGAFKAAAIAEKPIPKGTRNERRAVQAAARGPSNLEAFTPFKMLASLEQPVIMHFTSGSAKFWSTINPSNIVGMPNDLHLKHGVSVAGEWHMVGVIDCLPGTTDTVPDRFCGDGDNVFSAQMAVVLGEIKKIMGRPSDCYGITPLIIMREITAAARSD